MVPIFKGKGYIWNCSCYRSLSLLEHGIKAVERELDKRPPKIGTVNEMQYDFMHERERIDAVFTLRRL